MTRSLRLLLRSTKGASAAEFALVLPLLLLLIFGMIDVGRYMWALNQAEKATQIGARMAAVTTAVSPDLIEADYAGGEIAVGDLIPATSLGTLQCTSVGCTCATIPCPVVEGDIDPVAFDVLVTRMQQISPGVADDNVVVSYSGSGFGFAGSLDASGGGSADEVMEISPLIRVSLTGMTFQPLSLLMMGSIPLPEFATTLTAEDASGSFSE